MFKALRINFTSNLDDESKLLKELRKQLRAGLEELPHDNLSRAVYVIRMRGDFLIAYKKKNSPVLYIGRGEVSQRVATHLKNWLHEVRKFGSGVSVEVRVAIPRRQRDLNFFKCVEADMLTEFSKIHGSIPFFNRRNEYEFADLRNYSESQKSDMRRAIMIGSGNRPKWALKPTLSNKNFANFMKGEHFEE